MSSILNAKRAVERTLSTAFPTTKIAFEGISFNPPNNELYLSCSFRVNSPTDPVLGKDHFRENITCNILVLDVPNKGTGNAYTFAENIRTVLDKGSSFLESTSRIHILSTPQIAGSSINSSRIVVPVIVSLTVEAYRD